MRFVIPALALFALTLLAPARESDATTVRLMKDDSAFRAMVPVSADGRLRQLADDPRTIFYDENVMPRLYQGVVGRTGWLDAYDNISGDSISRGGPEPFGNPNREFPWDRSAGLTRGDNAVSFKFMRLPPGGKIGYWTETVDPNQNGFQFVNVLAWNYPEGTEFGNCKIVLGPQGRRKVFEVELRRRDEKNWAPAVYRPVTTAQEYRAEFPLSDEAGQTETGAVTTLFDDPTHTPQVFRRKAVEDVLPQINVGDVDRLLAKPFRVVTRPWRTLPDAECAAPTTQADYQIVPKGYNGAWLRVSREDCMTCHSGAGTLHAERITVGRSWYGALRGNSGIFSFNIADPRLAPLLRQAR